jgi:hypothetical protein
MNVNIEESNNQQQFENDSKRRYNGGDFTFKRGDAAGKTIGADELNDWLMTLNITDTPRILYHWTNGGNAIRWGTAGIISDDEFKFICVQGSTMYAGGG